MVEFAGGEPAPEIVWEREKFRVSAASVAVHFMANLPTATRSHIRSIVLLEDRAAVAWPQCHAQGLIPYCQENSNLRIERRVSLWRAVFPAGAESVFCVALGDPDDVGPNRIDVLRADSITRQGLAPWIMEAIALPQFGMPPQSFSLIIDGEPTSDKSAWVFQSVIQRDAAWQTAFEKHCTRQTEEGQWAKIRENDSFLGNGFPQALRNITSGQYTIVKCNFDPGEEWDPGYFVRKGRNWTRKQWQRNWYDHEPRQFDMDTPLPCWLGLRLEDALPE